MQESERSCVLAMLANFYWEIGDKYPLQLWEAQGQNFWGVELKLNDYLAQGCQVVVLQENNRLIGFHIYNLGPVGMMWSRAVYLDPRFRKGFYLLKMVNPLWKLHGIVKMFGETYASHDPYGPSPRKEIVSRKDDLISWIYHIRGK